MTATRPPEMAAGPADAPLNGFRASNFAPAFLFLPADRRRALGGLYAFCRAVDDAVDRGDDPDRAGKTLEAWRRVLLDTAAPADPAVDVGTREALRGAIDRYGVDPRHLLGLIDGVEMDLGRRRYGTFEELLGYCYGVASTVGLACLPIFGLREEDHRDFAVQLGYAVQLTNILRDVGADAAQGRIYLPREDLERFGCSEEEVLARAMTPALGRVLRFTADRARGFYAGARAALPASSLRRARPALMMGGLYAALLDKLEGAGFPVFEKDRVRLSASQKIGSVAKVFWREWVS